MKVDFTGEVKSLADMRPGAFFIGRKEGEPICGMSAHYGGDGCAVLFSRAVRADEQAPCVVTQQFLANEPLIELPDASIMPALDLASMQFRSAGNGPGEIYIVDEQRFLRVARRSEGFFYVDLDSGVVGPLPDKAHVKVPRWSVGRRGPSGLFVPIFAFEGPVA